MLKKFLVIVILLSSCSLLDLNYYKDARDPVYNYNQFWNELNDYYGLIDFKTERHIAARYGSWKGLYKDHLKYIDSDTTERELFSVLSSILYILKDSHSYWLIERAPEIFFELPNVFDFPHPPGIEWGSNNGDRDPRDSFGHGAYYSDLRIPSGYIKDAMYFGDNLIYSGIIDFESIYSKSHIESSNLDENKKYGYIYIVSFIKNEGLKNLNAAQDWSNEIDLVIDHLGEIDGLIIDVRHNSGGFEGNLHRILKRFIKEERTLYYSYTRDGPDKNDFRKEKYTASPVNKGFRGKTVLLTDRATSSCGDLFALTLKDEEHVTLIGQNTHGVLSKVIARELPIGWSFRMSSGYTESIDGSNFEEVGVEPDIIIDKDSVAYLYNTYYESEDSYYYYDPIFCIAVEVLDSQVTENIILKDILEGI